MKDASTKTEIDVLAAWGIQEYAIRTVTDMIDVALPSPKEESGVPQRVIFPLKPPLNLKPE